MNEWGKLGMRERMMETGAEIPEEDVRNKDGWSKSRDEGKQSFGRPLSLHLG